MRFDLKRPCKACPFRTDRPGYLDPERAAEIATSLMDDDYSWFGCHETTIADDNGDLHCGDETQHCQGALQFLLGTTGLNIASRIAVLTGELKLDEVDRSVPVANSKKAFVDHHSKARGDLD